MHTYVYVHTTSHFFVLPMDEVVKHWAWHNLIWKVHEIPNRNTTMWLPVVLDIWLSMTHEPFGSPVAVITQLMVGHKTLSTYVIFIFLWRHPCPQLCSPNKVLNEPIIWEQLNRLWCFRSKHPQPCCHCEVCSVTKELFQPWIECDLGRDSEWRPRLAFLLVCSRYAHTMNI